MILDLGQVGLKVLIPKMSRFWDCYCIYLFGGTIWSISSEMYIVEKLMQSVASGKDGFLYLSKVLEVLLQTLLQDQISEVKKHLIS